jgi:hypothetical protein
MTGSPVKKNNHEVPCGLLKNWLSNRRGISGHYYIEVGSNRPIFNPGRKAKFAVTEYLYVPHTSASQRDDSLEDWFMVDENELARFAQAAQRGNLRGQLKPKAVEQSIRACIALGSRSAYHFFMVANWFKQNPEFRTEGTLHLQAVQNARTMFEVKWAQFKNWDFTVLYNIPNALLINEQPFRDWTLRENGPEMITMPLGPHTLLAGSPPKMPNRQFMEIGVKDHSNDRSLAQLHNSSVVETARQWVVGTSEDQLSAIAASLSKPEVERRTETDRGVLFHLSAE